VPVPRYQFRDVVDTKGSGVVFLLYGPPGTGKTLAVEALAARFARPLYSLSFAELGSSVAELEERLQDVLALAAHWDALVLLDEGDALVEKRARGQLLLNSMTGVLLRLLEGFDGSLFITSNRAASFDPAALSRVTLAVRFDALDAHAKEQVWTNMLARIVGDAEHLSREEAQAQVLRDFDMTSLAKFAGSGRAVGAIIRLALGLCGQRRSRLTQTELDDAIAVWESFHQDLSDEGVADTWDD
jgi:SpoVK/Ycf46/Vps4 family AAA+-type ATPase